MNFNSCMHFGSNYTDIELEAKENSSCNPQEYTPYTPNPDNHCTVNTVLRVQNCRADTVGEPLDSTLTSHKPRQSPSYYL